MKKFAKPWFRPARGVWYVTLDGHQHNLGPDKEAAFSLYKQLLSEPKPKARRASDSLAVVIDAFLEWVQRNRSPDTYVWYQYRLQRFFRKYPDLRASEVRPFHVEDWVNGYKLSITSRRNYMRTVKRCLKWAKKQGYLEVNPVADLEIPAAEHREGLMSQEEIELLLATIKDEGLRDLVVVTLGTGCRPQESLRVEARHVDLANQRWVFPKGESKNKKLSRVVYLNDDAAAITAKLVERYPTGKLFRNSHGKPWTPSAVNCSFIKIQMRIGMRLIRERGMSISDEAIKKLIPSLKAEKTIKGELVNKRPAELREEAKRKLTYKLASSLAPKWSLYGLRHSWATTALRRGVDPLTVAILMGHSDPSMLSKVYQHLSLNPTHMLQQAKRAVG
ncbi:MAG: tyrosine-type recombinase/integrase [Pirellulales bacterium]